MAKNCFDCKWASWLSNSHGECAYPLPRTVMRYMFSTGVWSELRKGVYGADSEKVGAYRNDGSLIEIKNCPMWEHVGGADGLE